MKNKRMERGERFVSIGQFRDYVKLTFERVLRDDPTAWGLKLGKLHGVASDLQKSSLKCGPILSSYLIM